MPAGRASEGPPARLLPARRASEGPPADPPARSARPRPVRCANDGPASRVGLVCVPVGRTGPTDPRSRVGLVCVSVGRTGPTDPRSRVGLVSNPPARACAIHSLSALNDQAYRTGPPRWASILSRIHATGQVRWDRPKVPDRRLTVSAVLRGRGFGYASASRLTCLRTRNPLTPSLSPTLSAGGHRPFLPDGEKVPEGRMRGLPISLGRVRTPAVQRSSPTRQGGPSPIAASTCGHPCWRVGLVRDRPARVGLERSSIPHLATIPLSASSVRSPLSVPRSPEPGRFATGDVTRLMADSRRLHVDGLGQVFGESGTRALSAGPPPSRTR